MLREVEKVKTAKGKKWFFMRCPELAVGSQLPYMPTGVCMNALHFLLYLQREVRAHGKRVKIMRKICFYLDSFWFVKDAWETDLKLHNPQHALQFTLKLCASSYIVSFSCLKRLLICFKPEPKRTTKWDFLPGNGKWVTDVQRKPHVVVPGVRPSPAKVQLPEVHDFPPPALGGPCVVGAARVVLGGA